MRFRSIPTFRSGDDTVRLRPFEPADLPALHEWQGDWAWSFLWTPHLTAPSLEEFTEEFKRLRRRSIDTIFTIIDPSDDSIAGMVYNYRAHQRDGITYVCLCLRKEKVAKGLGMAAALLFGDYLFRLCGFRKVYAEIFGFNRASLRLARRYGFVEEGRLREYRWMDDRYHDLHILALGREQFLRIKSRYGRDDD